MVTAPEPESGGPKAIAVPFFCQGHPVVDDVERKFVHHDGAYMDMPGVSVCDRYALVRGCLPDVMRGRRLYDDLTDIFARAEREFSGARLFAAYDLAALQGHFYWVMHINKMCRRPAYEYHRTLADYWKRRLADREKDTLPWRWGAGDAVLSPHLPVKPAARPLWRLN